MWKSLTASSRENDQEIAFSKLNGSGDEQGSVDKHENSDKDQVDRIVLDVRLRQLMRQVDLMLFLASFSRNWNQPAIDTEN